MSIIRQYEFNSIEELIKFMTNLLQEAQEQALSEPEPNPNDAAYNELQFDEGGWSIDVLQSVDHNIINLHDTDIVRFNHVESHYVKEAKQKGLFSKNFGFQVYQHDMHKQQAKGFAEKQVLYYIIDDTFQVIRLGSVENYFDEEEIQSVLDQWQQDNEQELPSGSITTLSICKKYVAAIEDFILNNG